MSLVAEIKTNSRNTIIKKLIIVFLMLAFSYAWYSYFFSSEKIDDTKTEEKIATVKKWNLKTFIEADSRVVLKDEINLDFNIDWQVKEIYKNPWDYVKKWEKIASLDSEYLDISIKKAEIALQIAQSNYEIKKRWVSDTEIDISQKQLDKDRVSLEISQKELDIEITSLLRDIEIAKRDLETVKKEKELDLIQSKNNLDIVKIDYDNSYANLEITVKQEQEKYKSQASKLVMETGQMITNLEKYLYDIDMLLGITDTNKYQNDSFEIYLWAKNSSLKNMTENSFRTTKTNFDTFYLWWEEYRKSIDLSNIDSFTELEKKVLKFSEIYKELNKTLTYTVDVLRNSISSSSFSQISIDNYINSFETSLSQSKKDNSDYIILYQSLEEAKISLEAKILLQEKEIQSNSWKILIAQSNLEKTILQTDLDVEKTSQRIIDLENNLNELKQKKQNTLALSQAQTDISLANLENKKYSDSLDLEPFYMAVLQASETLKEAQKKRQDSILYAPIDWKIAQINAKVSESTNSLKDSFATIINDNSFFVESYVEESDIVKVKNNQDVYITFDAIDGLTLTWKVLYIEDKATIDSNSIVSYKVEISFSNTDKRVKDAMTATTEFITKEVKNVFIIPVSAVKNISWKPSVIIGDWSIRQVITGFTDWKLVEVISWLQVWDKVKY